MISLDLAAETLRCGGEVYRAEETMRRINGEKCRVFALPTLIAAEYDGKALIRRIYGGEINLSRLAYINSLSRNLCGESNCKREYNAYNSPFIDALCNFFATASFCLFFGGNAIDCLFSGIIGVFITTAGYKKISFPLFSSNLIDSFIAALLSLAVPLAGFNAHSDKIIIGTIMLLVPGLTVVNAIRDMTNSDLAAGLFELFNAVMSALSIALGVAGAYFLFGEI